MVLKGLNKNSLKAGCNQIFFKTQSYMNTIVNAKTLCVHQVTKEALW